MNFEIKVYSTYEDSSLVWYALSAQLLAVGKGRTPGKAIEAFLDAARRRFDERLGEPW